MKQSLRSEKQKKITKLRKCIIIIPLFYSSRKGPPELKAYPRDDSGDRCTNTSRSCCTCRGDRGRDLAADVGAEAVEAAAEVPEAAAAAVVVEAERPNSSNTESRASHRCYCS